jgi:hypothetical protein
MSSRLLTFVGLDLAFGGAWKCTLAGWIIAAPLIAKGRSLVRRKICSRHDARFPCTTSIGARTFIPSPLDTTKMHSRSVVMEMLRRSVGACVIGSMTLISAAAASGAHFDRKTGARLELIGKIADLPIGNDRINDMKWCYDKKPAIALLTK